jgi:hypothetical protein
VSLIEDVLSADLIALNYLNL